MAEALAALLAQRYRTAKDLARGVGIDLDTAKNLHKGHLSVTTLQKVLAAEGRELWNRLGDELYGETFYDFEERRITAALREAEHGLSNVRRLREEGAQLLASAARMDEASAGRGDASGRDSEGRARSGADQVSGSAPESTRARGAR
jgi:hypothetical protein